MFSATVRSKILGAWLTTDMRVRHSESGMLAIYDGLTTIDEVVRETLGEE